MIPRHPVYRALNRPLTVLGAERRLFFMAVVMGAATFNLFGSLMGGLLMFAALWIAAVWATSNDPQILRILLSSGRWKIRYDPAKFTAVSVDAHAERKRHG